MRGNRLELGYRYTEPQEGSYTVKEGLCLRIAKGSFDEVVFFENGRHAATLEVGKGQWSIPAAANEDN